MIGTEHARTELVGVFAGGGVRGIALAGAAAATMDAGYRFSRVVGTSAGALVGALVAAGYDASDLGTAVGEIPWPELADHSPGGGLPFIGRHLSMVTGRALYRGDRLEEIWSDLLGRRGVSTFADLPDGALRVVATDITHQRGIVLPDDLSRYGENPATFPVARAVRMSATAPFVFSPVKLGSDDDAALVVDGALAANFPLRLATGSAEEPTIGFRLVPGDEEHIHLPVKGPASLARAVIGAGIRAADSLPSTFLTRAVVVDLPVGGDPLEFDIPRSRALELFNAGYIAVTGFMAARGPIVIRGPRRWWWRRDRNERKAS